MNGRSLESMTQRGKRSQNNLLYNEAKAPMHQVSGSYSCKYKLCLHACMHASSWHSWQAQFMLWHRGSAFCHIRLPTCTSAATFVLYKSTLLDCEPMFQSTAEWHDHLQCS